MPRSACPRASTRRRPWWVITTITIVASVGVGLGVAGCDAGLASNGSSGSSRDGGVDTGVNTDGYASADANDLGCASEAVDAWLGECRLPLPKTGGTFDCAASWAEQKIRSCKPGVVVFVSADNAPAGQLIWFERPWLSGGTSCFYAPATELLVGSWYVSDNATHCCRTSYDVTYGAFDTGAHEAGVRAAQPWVGRFYDTSGTEPVDGGEVRYCASVREAAPAEPAPL